MKNLTPAHRIVPGACACSTAIRGCVCAPEDMDDQLAQLADARHRADDARDRGDTIAERQWRDVQRSIAASLRAALEPKPDKTEADIRADMIDRLINAWHTPAPTTEDTEDDDSCR